MQSLPTSTHFYPRPPRGGRPQLALRCAIGAVFLSTSSARRTTCSIRPPYTAFSISIHVLREEDDGEFNWDNLIAIVISIHVLREEDDLSAVAVVAHVHAFLSTSSARRTTCSLLEKSQADIFLSTSSARRTTYLANPVVNFIDISIHVLREEDDGATERKLCNVVNFYPRPPRGGRQISVQRKKSAKSFLSTSSARRTTSLPCIVLESKGISIHVLREEDDWLILSLL